MMHDIRDGHRTPATRTAPAVVTALPLAPTAARQTSAPDQDYCPRVIPVEAHRAVSMGRPIGTHLDSRSRGLSTGGAGDRLTRR